MSKTALKWLILSIMLVVIGIVVLAPPYFGHVDTKLKRAKSDIEIISRALELYQKNHGSYPDTTKGLHVLVEPGDNAYLDYLPVDPWGNEYQYQYPGVHNITSYDLSSRGPSATNANAGGEYRIGNWQ